MKLFAILLCFLVAVQAQEAITNVLTKENRASWVESLQQDASSWVVDASVAQGAVQAMELFGVPLKNKKALCKAAGEGLDTSDVSMRETMQWIHVLSKLDCLKGIPEHVLGMIEHNLEEEDVTAVAYAVQALSLLNKAQLQKDFDMELLNEVPLRLTEGLKDDFVEIPETVGLVYVALADLMGMHELEDEERVEIDVLFERAEDLFDSAELAEDTMSIPFRPSEYATVGPGETAAVLLRGYRDLALALDTEMLISNEVLVAVTEFVVHLAGVPSVQEAAGVLETLDILGDRAAFKQVVGLQVLTPHIHLKNKKGMVQVLVTDVAGTPLPDARVVLSSASTTRGALLSNVDLLSDGQGVFQFAMATAKPLPGRYVLDLLVSVGNDAFMDIRNVHREVRVITSVDLASATLAISDTNEEDGTDVRRYLLNYPKGREETLRADDEQHLFFTFNVKNKVTSRPMKAQQVFVKFEHMETSQAVYFIAYPNNELGTYKLTINLAESGAEHFGYLGGDYRMELVVGDSYIDNAFSYKMAEIELHLKDPCHSDEPECRKLLQSLEEARHHEMLSFYQPKKDIEHTFATPEPRPSSFVSDVWTGVIVAVFAVTMLVFLPFANWKRFPKDATAGLWAVVYQATILCIFGSYLMFWLKWNMFQTLGVVAVLTIVALIAGREALSDLATPGWRTKVE